MGKSQLSEWSRVTREGKCIPLGTDKGLGSGAGQCWSGEESVHEELFVCTPLEICLPPGFGNFSDSVSYLFCVYLSISVMLLFTIEFVNVYSTVH